MLIKTFSVRQRGVLCILLIILVSGWANVRALRTAKLHPDEPGWIGSTYYYSDLLITRNWDDKAWHGTDLLPFGYDNPPFSRWVMGSVLKPYEWLTGRRYDWLTETHNTVAAAPSRDILLVARLLSVAFGIGSCVLTFFIISMAYRMRAGLLAALFVANNYLFLSHTTAAIVDSYYVFFMLAFLLSCVWLMRMPPQASLIKVCALSGLLTVCAAYIKITGLPICAATFLCCAYFRNRHDKSALKQLMRMNAVYIIATLIFLYGMNPFLWHLGYEPVSQNVSHHLPSDDPASAFNTQGTWGFMRLPLLYPQWSKFMDKQVNQGLGLWGHSRLVSIHKNLIVYNYSFRGDILLSLAACFVMLPQFIKMCRGRLYSPMIALLVFFGFNYLVLLLFLKLNWNRYYLISVLLIRMIDAIAAVQIGAYFWRLYKKSAPENLV